MTKWQLRKCKNINNTIKLCVQQVLKITKNDDYYEPKLSH